MDFKTLRTNSGMSLTDFGKMFNIPYRTLQHWEQGTRKCPPYVLELIKYRLDNEKGRG